MAERRRAEWVIWRRGVVISFLLHLLIFLLWRVDAVPVSPFAAAGPQEGDPSAAAGGGMTAITLVIAEPRAIPRPPQPIFSPDAVVVEELRVEDVQGATDLSGLLAVDAGPPGLGPPGPGLEGGTGRGDGGNAAEGLNRLTPPTPRSVIIPPTNRSLRGRQVEVWVWVNEQGRVVADSTQLRPPTSDRAFNRLLMAEAARWVFEPARQGGVPVAGWFPYTYSVSR